MDSEEVVQKVRNDQRSGNRSGVRSTPTVFINGDLAVVGTVSDLVELVSEAYDDAGGG
jgi:protein-disulfide isomerase